MPMDAGKDGKKGTKDDKPAFLKKEEMTAEGRGKKTKANGWTWTWQIVSLNN